MSPEKQLIKEIKKIVYEHEADPDLINALVIRFRLSISKVNRSEAEHLIYCACIATNADAYIVISKNRKGTAVRARYLVWNHIRTVKPSMSYRRIGLLTGGHDHSTVMHGLAALKQWLEYDKEIIEEYKIFNKLIESC
jgi:chromosomal replication initiation ATPase DnaA